ncbi:MAG: hypothetical protein N4A74_21565 [Carboxylicivirga sp.]|jgi:hypothetical protein|nr:hypothetical protein [Carboxylicivirga sp.]
MKEFKGRFIPPINDDMEVIQEAHCTSVNRECDMNDCDTCLFGSDNLEQFTEWYFNADLAKTGADG